MCEAKDLLDAPQLSLAAEVLASGGVIRLRVRGTSMLPSVWPGDVLAIQSTARGEVVLGDVVLVLRDDRFCIHRLVERRQDQDCMLWITKGDAVPLSDPPVDDSQLLGKVLFIQRNRRIIALRRGLSPATRLFAWMLCHGDRFRSICLRLHFWWQNLHQQIGEEIVECPTSTS